MKYEVQNIRGKYGVGGPYWKGFDCVCPNGDILLFPEDKKRHERYKKGD